MSNDAFTPSEPQRDPAYYDPDAPGVPPPDVGPDVQAARDRVQIPAILLIVAGVLNLLVGAFVLFRGIQAAQMPPEQMRQAMIDQKQEKQLEQMEKQGYTIEGIKQMVVGVLFTGGGGGLVTGLLAILGGVQMLKLRAYALCILASLAAAVPLISCTACCGLGEIVGLWSLIVLLSGDVRAAFR